jgi:hypothetical protein
MVAIDIELANRLANSIWGKHIHKCGCSIDINKMFSTYDNMNTITMMDFIKELKIAFLDFNIILDTKTLLTCNNMAEVSNYIQAKML